MLEESASAILLICLVGVYFLIGLKLGVQTDFCKEHLDEIELLGWYIISLILIISLIIGVMS